QADEQALMNAQSQRDQQLANAQNDRDNALKQHPGDDQKINADDATRVQQIREGYEKERERILGYSPPTTQP
ncbi:MAG TPA: hypothetical protein VKK61_12175, partial [Tepidisphaeraceae bacterium]|nr:hypothetical protein [Tepidisphaeraceae bacterium]